MKRCIIIGKTNVGKTLFAIQFAAHLGLRELTVTSKAPGGESERITYPIDVAVRELVSDGAHRTRSLQSIIVELPVGKGVKRFELMDTSGLIEGIPSDVNIRRAMAQTLAAVRDAHIVLHIIDASRATRKGAVEALGEVDYQVAQFALMRGGYLILANKMDLPGAREGLELIRQEFAGHPVVPISALERGGFREVKRFVWRWL